MQDAAVLAPQAAEQPPTGYGVVVGNCQAESVRLVIDSPETPTIRTRAVHEMTADDARALHDLLRDASFLVSQPIRDDYHDLPLGTAQLRASLPTGAPSVVVPVIRFAGLHPFQVAIRMHDLEYEPPLVGYHDVRLLAEAAGSPVRESLAAGEVRAIAAESVGELARREQHTDIRVSDLFHAPRFAQMRTINHPGNAVFLPVGERILRALGRGPEPTDPGRPILSAVRAPREDWVIDAWESDAAPHPDWMVNGDPLPAAQVREAHLDWYAANPAFVEAATRRLAPLLARWA